MAAGEVEEAEKHWLTITQLDTDASGLVGYQTPRQATEREN